MEQERESSAADPAGEEEVRPKKKPWQDEPRGRQLEAFLGCWGARTSEIETTDDLKRLAADLYELRTPMSVQAMAEEIQGLAKRRRRFLAHKNFEAVFGVPIPVVHRPIGGAAALGRDVIDDIADVMAAPRQDVLDALEGALDVIRERRRIAAI